MYLQFKKDKKKRNEVFDKKKSLYVSGVQEKISSKKKKILCK